MKVETGASRKRRLIAEMNLIPLIDVSLILVIIFMVLTPILVQHQLTVKLPKAVKTLLVQADRTVAVEKVVGVLDIAKRLGVGKLGVGVTPEGE